jgi:shikimate dehydrogenase
MNLSAVMHPMDTQINDLPSLISALRADSRFIGGAVTMPYKIHVMSHMDRIEPEAELIGAVNCIYRDNNSLVGANTDGAAAIWSLKKKLAGDLTGFRALVIGAGGAGFAVSTYLAKELGPDGKLWLANRSAEAGKNLAGRLRKICSAETVEWPPVTSLAKEIDLLINCTSIGFNALRRDETGAYCLRWYSPLGFIPQGIRSTATDEAEAARQYLRLAAEEIGSNIRDSLSFLSLAGQPLIMDIVYQPEKTILLQLAEHLGLPILNGVGMNLEQAVISFDKATSAAGLRSALPDNVRLAMEKIY